MKDSLQPGLTVEFTFKVPENKTVPFLYPEFGEGLVMPKVLATGFLLGLYEFSCIKALNPHLDWPNEQTVGIGMNMTHTAATPEGMTITVKGKLEKVEGRKLTFSLEAFDDAEKISQATHERFVINAEKFNAALAKKMGKK
ncbi:MAG TPA: thioesterase [Syntrophaceae bacterium]|jgi:fluoroacetyl-CoA thioesterase|nr:thioesterase [Syntrophaceae bacterium]